MNEKDARSEGRKNGHSAAMAEMIGALLMGYAKAHRKGAAAACKSRMNQYNRGEISHGELFLLCAEAIRAEEPTYGELVEEVAANKPSNDC